MAKNKDRVFGHLLAIPICLVFDCILFWGAAYADVRFFDHSEAMGHGMPVFTLLAMIVAVILTLIVVIVSVKRTVKACVRRNRERNKDRDEDNYYYS